MAYVYLCHMHSSLLVKTDMPLKAASPSLKVDCSVLRTSTLRSGRCQTSATGTRQRFTFKVNRNHLLPNGSITFCSLLRVCHSEINANINCRRNFVALQNMLHAKREVRLLSTATENVIRFWQHD